MDLRQLRHFLKVVELSSFRAAAEELNLSQPALSKSIRNLELRLKVKLLERGPLRVTPTLFGARLVEYAKLIEMEVEHAVAEIEAMRGACSGRVVVGSGPSLIRTLLPQACMLFHQRRPGIDVVVVEGLKETLIAGLRRGELDLAVSTIANQSTDHDIEQIDLFTEEIVIAARRGHPLCRKDQVSLEDLTAYEWVVPEAREIERERLEAMFLDAGLPIPRAAIHTASWTFMMAVLPVTDLLTYLPSRLASIDLGEASLAALSFVAGPWQRRVGISHRRRGVLSPAARAYISDLRELADQGKPLASRPLHWSGR